ncbi:DUF4192 domain-containing protein [Corynebacterium sp. TAE3-ERU12]|uniref:DUF4192 family protein n=1 Tax=Corynebacterium sp. TAE3-ERU12 TaxID=2849491 RepID=UPI001C458DAB|nr:DUF4192 family protein [Corynebacterium sp. TAE3-ERU12]MBV7295311.1 DUF4192 domain-containing protein [Corynebacterium sp. TAE3-ERU12]
MPDTSSQPQPFDLDTIAFFTNLPGYLGFHPSNIVAMLMRTEASNPTGPYGAYHPEQTFKAALLIRNLDKPDELADDIRNVLVEDTDVEWVDFFFISPEWAHPVTTTLGEDLAAVVRTAGVKLGVVAGVAAISPGTEIYTPDGCMVGWVGDPAQSCSALALAQSGEAIAPDFAALAQRFEPDPFAPQELIQDVVAQVQAQWQEILRTEVPQETWRRRQRWWRQWNNLVDAIDAGKRPICDILSDREAIEIVAQSLCDLTIRDMTMSVISDYDREPVVRAIWLAAGRCLGGELRAHALACYALDRYAMGSYTAAQYALEAAAQTFPGHNLSSLLSRAINTGQGDMAVSTMLSTSYELIKEMAPHHSL